MTGIFKIEEFNEETILFLRKSLEKLQCTFKRADLYFVSTVLLTELKKITFQLKDRINVSLQLSRITASGSCNNTMHGFPVECVVDSAFCS